MTHRPRLLSHWILYEKREKRCQLQDKKVGITDEDM
jgi:hypothetical protein